MPEDRILNNCVKTYLIGPMESTAKNDEGKGWRDRLRPELENRVDKNGNHIYVFDPTLNEEAKVGLPTREFHKQLHNWLASGQRDKVKDAMEIIWKGKTYEKPVEGKSPELIHIPGDIDYVRQSNFLIAYLEEGDSPCGTYCETILAYIHNIPIYLIQDMALNKYSKTFIGFVLGSGGDIFPNQKQLLEFLDEKYKLKIKELKESK